MGESVNIKEYLDMFRRRKWIIILVMLVCLGFGGYRTYTNYVSYLPTYKATVKIKINSMKEYNEAVEKSKSKRSSKKDTDDSTTGMTEEQRVLNNINSSYSASASMTNQNIASSYVVWLVLRMLERMLRRLARFNLAKSFLLVLFRMSKLQSL